MKNILILFMLILSTSIFGQPKIHNGIRYNDDGSIKLIIPNRIAGNGYESENIDAKYIPELIKIFDTADIFSDYCKRNVKINIDDIVIGLFHDRYVFKFSFEYKNHDFKYISILTITDNLSSTQNNIILIGKDKRKFVDLLTKEREQYYIELNKYYWVKKKLSTLITK